MEVDRATSDGTRPRIEVGRATTGGAHPQSVGRPHKIGLPTKRWACSPPQEGLAHSMMRDRAPLAKNDKPARPLT